MSRTFVVGGRVYQQRAWCEANGVKPYAQSTVLVGMDGIGCRGFHIQDDDRLVILGPLTDAMLENLMPALVFSPKNERLVLNHLEAAGRDE